MVALPLPQMDHLHCWPANMQTIGICTRVYSLCTPFVMHASTLLASELSAVHTNVFTTARVSLFCRYTLHSSIWLIDNPSNPARTGCPQEIDVVEQYAVGEHDAVSNAAANLHPFTGAPRHGKGECEKQKFNRTTHSTNAIGDWTTNFTTFTLDWTEEWIGMWVNGQPYARFAVER
jgi:hypothetical protein